MGRSRRRLIVAPALAAAALTLGACGEHGIQVAKDSPDYTGALIFKENCAACHTLDAVGSEGSATQIGSSEIKDGPNFNERKEAVEDVIYAIENGGFSSGPMPQNIVTGEQKQQVAEFVAKYSGSARAGSSGSR
jgi:mono/diheme cytochrome c family protein